METVLLPIIQPAQIKPAGVSAQARRAAMLLAGLLAPLGVFNTFTLDGNPVSLIWMAGAVLAWSPLSKVCIFHVPYFVLLFMLVVKLLMGGSVGVFSKFAIGTTFLYCLSNIKYEDGISFLKGIIFFLPASVLFAIYQWGYLIAVGSAAAATLPIELWNSKGWHVVLVDDYGIPRAPAFMFEPAYFAMILGLVLAGELLYRAGPPRRWLLFLIVVGLILANSRVGFLAAIVILIAGLLTRFQKLNLLRWLAIAAMIGPLLPLLFITEQITNFTEYRDIIDISVFARYISFAAFSQESFSAILFGVLDYQISFLKNPIFFTFSEFLQDQGSDMDPKSFLASNFFYFGIVGSIIFYVGQIYICRNSAVSLAMLASVNIIFFNVYAYSWPLYWIFVSLIFIVWKADVLELHRRQFASYAKAI